MSLPLPPTLGFCGNCRALTFIFETGLCHQCIVQFKHLRRRQRDQERLLASGLEDGVVAGSHERSTTPVVRKTAPPLFVLCVAYLSNNADLIEQEAIHYLPSEVRYFLFLLELSHKRFAPSFSKSSSASSSSSSAAPRLRLAKRFLSSINAISPFHSSSSSFEAFDFSALKSLTCLNPSQVENVFDYLTSFGRSSIEGLRILSLKGLPFINDAALKTVAAQMRLLRVLDVSFCDNITDEGIAALLPRFKPAQTRDSWEELEDGDSCSSEDSSDESSLLCGLLHLRRLGIYGCNKLTRATLKALRIAFTGRPALTVYTSMLLVRGVDDDDGHAYAYDDRAVVLLAAAARKPDPALWEVTAAAAADSSRADREWGADEEAEPSREKPKTPHEHEEDVGVDRRHPAEGSLKVVTFVNDTLQWNVAEEEAVYALHGYQIEEIEELRGRYYAPHQEEDGGSIGIGLGGGGGRQRAPPAKKKARPSLYVPWDEQLQALDEIRDTKRAEHSYGSLRKRHL